MTNNISESKDYKLQEFSLKQINKNNSFLKKTSFVMDFDCKALTLFYWTSVWQLQTFFSLKYLSVIFVYLLTFIQNQQKFSIE